MSNVKQAPLTREFVLAGRATFVTENLTGDTLTISIKKAKDTKLDKNGRPYPPNYWVSLRHGNSSWAYAGVLNVADLSIRPTKKSVVPTDDLAMKVAQWVLKLINDGEDVPEGYRLEHTGRCCRCGKMLRDDESIRVGIGPECRKEMGL